MDCVSGLGFKMKQVKCRGAIGQFSESEEALQPLIGDRQSRCASDNSCLVFSCIRLELMHGKHFEFDFRSVFGEDNLSFVGC